MKLAGRGVCQRDARGETVYSFSRVLRVLILDLLENKRGARICSSFGWVSRIDIALDVADNTLLS